MWLALAACGEDGETGAGGAGDVPEEEARPDVLGSLPGAPVEWAACGAVECATLQVPLDNDVPGGEMISIAINRVRANPQVEYLGVIFINPGGPGLPGRAVVEQAAQFFAARYPDFDIIGFDPRGTGGSSPLRCVIDQNPALSFAEGGVPAAIAAYASLNTRCREAVGPIIDHVGTNEVVQDIEYIRQALAQDEINFWGVSFGTRLGAAYAQAFPERVRALVLDAPLAPRADYVEFVDAQYDALLRAQSELFAACSSGELTCPAEPEAAFDRLIEQATAMGIDEAVLNSWVLYLSTYAGRAFLAQILSADPATALGPTMGMTQPTDPGVMDLLANANVATNFSAHCTDNLTPPLDMAEAEALMASFRERSEVFLTNGVPALACSGWAVERDPVPELAFTPSTPPLVIAGLHDNLTPSVFGEELAQSLGGARLLLSDHYGHSVTTNGGLCTSLALRRYLVNLELPEEGTTCPAPTAEAAPPAP
jgi:pimeloyl-ACP methyl ester carboxylesterase